MELGLKDKVALVTGTGSRIGMGRTIALTLAKEGCHIVSADIDGDGAKQTADEVKALGRRAMTFQGDLTRLELRDSIIERMLAEWKRIDILVNNAGTTARASSADFALGLTNRTPMPGLDSTLVYDSRDVKLRVDRIVEPGGVEAARDPGSVVVLHCFPGTECC